MEQKPTTDSEIFKNTQNYATENNPIKSGEKSFKLYDENKRLIFDAFLPIPCNAQITVQHNFMTFRHSTVFGWFIINEFGSKVRPSTFIWPQLLTVVVNSQQSATKR